MGTSLAAESLLSLAVTVTAEQRVESVFQSIVQGLASQPGVALARIWLFPSADLPSCYHTVSDPPDCLRLVASAGTPISSPGEDWCFLQGQFARVPFNLGKVGQIAASRRPILVEDVAAQNEWVVRPEWATREKISSFAGHPLIFRDKLLGVIAVFSRHPLGQQEFSWLGLFANQAALAIANACAEEALQSRDHNLAVIINTIPTAAWTTRPDGYCDFLNQVWLDYAGMTAEQAQGWGWAQAIHADERKRLVEEWRACLDSGTPVDTEARIRRFDGSHRWFLIRGNPLRNEAGKILKWYGTCIDIEDHKRVEENLRSTELSWRQIVDNVPGLVATMGATGEVEFLNRQTLEYFGKTNEELKNWSLIGAVHPDDLPAVIAAREKCLATGQIYEVEHRCRRADGVYRWFQVRGLPVRDAEGTITTWYLLLTDIHDRKKAEEALSASERNLRSIMNTIPAHIYVLNTEGSVTYVNRAVMDYTGLTLEDVQQDDYRARVIHPEDFKRVHAMRTASLKSAAPFNTEQRVLGSDGQYRWFLVRYQPLLDEHGDIVRWYVAASDIEDRKRAEEALQSSQRNLSQLINAIPNVIAVLSTGGSMLYANQTALDYTGLTLEDVQSEDSRSRIFHPEDVKKLRDERREALTRAVPFGNEQRVLGKDGKYRWFLIRYHPLLDEQGRIDRWYVAATDIHDRKKAEEALQSSERNLSLMINAIPTSIYVLRADGSVLYASQAALDYSGVTLEDVRKEDYRARFFHPEDVERLRDERREALTRAVPFENEQRVLGKDGEYRWFLIRYNPLLDQQGKVDRWYVAGTDIEDRKQAENVRLEERSRIARELHDTMLQSFQAALLRFHAVTHQLADRPELQRTLEGVVDQARQAVVEGRDAVQGLRSSTILTNDLARAIRILCAELEDQGNTRAPAFRVNVKGTPRDLAPILRDDIYRIAGEAVRNAFQHANAGNIEVQIHYDPRRLRLRVRDDGKGIDPKVLQLGARPGHYGLPGLQERAKLVSGRLTILSDPGSGTEIKLTVPASVIYASGSEGHAFARGKQAS